MANVFDKDDSVEKRIEKVSGAIQKRLETSLTPDGKVDLETLENTDAELRDVLDSYAASKTWRDDPHITAKDVAKLLEARSKDTPLGNALEKLGQSLGKP